MGKTKQGGLTMKVLKDKNWAWRTKHLTNTRIKAYDNVYDAFVYRGGGASVYVDDDTVINFEKREFEPIEILKGN